MITLTSRPVPVFTDWATYNPAFTSFGTAPTNNVSRWRRCGDSMDLDINFTMGTGAGSECRVGFPNSLVSDSGYPTLQWVGLVGLSINTAASFGITVEASKGYITFTDQGGSSNGLAKLVGSSFTAGTTLSLYARGIKITGWTTFT